MNRDASPWQRLFGSSSVHPLRGATTNDSPWQIELWLWGLCIFLLTNPFVFILTGIDPNVIVARDPTTMRQADSSQTALYIIRFGIVALAFLMAMPRWKAVSRNLGVLLPVVPFLFWVGLSALWTDSPDATFHGIFALIALVLFAYALSIRLRPSHMATAVIYSGIVMGVLSVLWALFLPHYGVHGSSDATQSMHAGSWRGVYIHKNHLGQIAALYAAGTLLAGRQVIGSLIVRAAILALMVLLIVKSSSVSALLVPPAAIFVVWILICIGPLQKMIATVYVIAGGVVGAMGLTAVLAIFGRDTSFTGRDVIWSLAFDSIAQQPLTGFGFVSTTYGEFTYLVAKRVGVFDPHNGYLDLLLGTGIVGLVLLAFIVARSLRRARLLFLMGGSNRQGALVLSAVLSAWLVACLTESNMRPLGGVATLGFLALSLLMFVRPERTMLRLRAMPPEAEREFGRIDRLDDEMAEMGNRG